MELIIIFFLAGARSQPDLEKTPCHGSTCPLCCLCDHGFYYSILAHLLNYMLSWDPRACLGLQSQRQVVVHIEVRFEYCASNSAFSPSFLTQCESPSARNAYCGFVSFSLILLDIPPLLHYFLPFPFLSPSFLECSLSPSFLPLFPLVFS